MSRSGNPSPSRHWDENHRPFNHSQTPAATHPPSQQQYYHYPPSQHQPLPYTSGVHWANDLPSHGTHTYPEPVLQFRPPSDPHFFQPTSGYQSFRLPNPAVAPSTLGDCTHSVTNSGQAGTSSSATQSTRKRKRLTEIERQNKRQTIADALESPISDVFYGIGPIDLEQAAPVPTPHPALGTRIRGPSLGSLVSPSPGTGNGQSTAASDTWYLVIGVESDVVVAWPDGHLVPLPPPAELKLRLSRERPAAKYKHFCCQLCECVYYCLAFFCISNYIHSLRDDSARKVWQNTPGQTTSIHNHLRGFHHEMWLEIVVSKELKG